MPNAHDVLFRTLADPTRRAIFERLCREGELTVGALTARAGVSQPAVSKHLRVLKQAGLLSERREGTRRLYSLNHQSLKPVRELLSEFWPDALSRLKQAVETDHPRPPKGHA